MCVTGLDEHSMTEEDELVCADVHILQMYKNRICTKPFFEKTCNLKLLQYYNSYSIIQNTSLEQLGHENKCSNQSDNHVIVKIDSIKTLMYL